MKKPVKIVLMSLGGLFLLAQFIRPAKNLSGDTTNDISKAYPVPDSVQAVLEVACNDCHSNKTVYPWYGEVQPTGSWLAWHVNDGKRHLNFSDFTSRPIAVQNHKFEEIIEMIREGEMPLPSYTWMHRDAVLSERDKELLAGWAQAMMDTLKANYPPDSLVLRR